jgi:CubicO group peptidase (beta-lactamase class C family)
MTAVHGMTAPGFEGVLEAFRENFDRRGEAGASFCAFADGRLVVDLWGGEARPGVPWERDTVAPVFSSSKGVTALTLQALADRGELDVALPVASYWPEFAAAGKGEITVRHVLTHTSGVIDFPGYRRVIDDPTWWQDPDRIAADFASGRPAWEPGSAHGYHGVSFGLILGEVVRRATASTLGEAFRELIGDPLDLDVWIGLPDVHATRVALLRDAPPVSDPLTAAYLSLFTQDTLTARAHFCDERGIGSLSETFNDPGFWRVEFPSGGAIASARGLAGMYRALAAGGSHNGTRIVSEASVRDWSAEAVRGPDLVLMLETSFGLGYQLPTPFIALAPADEAFGHGGLGGSLGFADPARNLAAAYVMNQLRFPSTTEITRAQALTEALYRAAGG